MRLQRSAGRRRGLSQQRQRVRVSAVQISGCCCTSQPVATRRLVPKRHFAAALTRHGASNTSNETDFLCISRSPRLVVQAALGCRANRVWASIVQFMNLPTITSTLSLVRRRCRRVCFYCGSPLHNARVVQVLLPAIDHSSEREVHLGILQCASLTQHVLLCSLLLVPHLRALCPLEQISEDSFSFWPLMNDVGRQLQRRGVVLRHSDGKCIGVEQFCLKWFRTLFCCCFECADLRCVLCRSRSHLTMPAPPKVRPLTRATAACSVLVLDRLIAHCHTSPSLMRDAAQQRSLMSHALLAIAVELATFVSANPDPHLSTLESLHVLRMSEEQLLLLLGKAAGRMQF
jgi:hypothetical protein